LPSGEEEGSGTPIQDRPVTKTVNIFDLESLDQALPRGTNSNPNPTPTQSNSKSLLDDDFFTTPSPKTTSATSREVVLTPDKGNGMQISATVVKKDGQISMEMAIFNQSSVALSDFAMQFNKNSFSLMAGQMSVPMIMPGQSVEVSVPLGVHPTMQSPPPVNQSVHICVKNNTGKFYFFVNVPLHVLLNENGALGREEYVAMWKTITDEVFHDMPKLPTYDVDTIQRKLQANNIFYIARRNVSAQDFLYFSAKVGEGIILLELGISPGGCKSCIRTKERDLVPAFEQSLVSLLTS